MPELLVAVEGTIDGGVELRFIELKERLKKLSSEKYSRKSKKRNGIYFLSITVKIEFNKAEN
jgi:hypothetical protein